MKKFIGLLLSLCLCTFLFSADQANFPDIYIDGSSAGDGSLASPYSDFSDINWTTGGDNSVFDHYAGAETASVTINLAKGVEWREQLTIGESGSATYPIIIRAYGDGADPIINGAIDVTTWDETDISAGTGDLSDESFEGAGYEESWTETVGDGTVDEDNADVARPLGGGDQILKVARAAPDYATETQRDLGSDQAVTYTRFYFQVTAEGLSNNETMVIARAFNAAYELPWQMSLVQNGDGDLLFNFRPYNNGAYAYYYSDVVVIDTWYRFDVKYDNTGHTWAWRIDEVTQDSGTITGTHYTGPRVWRLGGETEFTITSYYDLFGISSTSWISGALELPAGCWKASLSVEATQVWFVETDDSVSWGNEESVATDCDAEYDYYYHPGGYLICYAATDPDARYSFVEASQRDAAIDASSSGSERDYITIQDLELACVGKWGVRNYGGDNQTVDSCTIHHAEIKNGSNGDGVHFQNTQNGAISNNTIHNCGNHGIYVLSNGVGTSSDNVVENNEVYDCYHSQIDSHNSGGTMSGYIVRYNKLYTTTDYDYSFSGQGIIVLGTSGNTHDDAEIYYNIIYKVCGDGIYVGAYTDGTKVYNNVIYGKNANYAAWAGGINVHTDSSGSIVIKNNIATETRDEAFYVGASADISACDNNLWYMASGDYSTVDGTGYDSTEFAAYKSATSWDTNGLWEDPKLIDAANDDFRLLMASPCVDAGTAVGLLVDYLGRQLRHAPDMGAYEEQTNAVF